MKYIGTKVLFMGVLSSLLFFGACKQQNLIVKPGATVSKDGTNDGMSNVESDFEGASRTDEGIQVTLSSDVLFPTNSSYLTDQAKTELAKLADMLKRQGGKKIRVDGHTDATGTAEYNVWLSEKRAVSVKNFLVEHGVSERLISTRGLGQTHPVDTNKTPEGRQKNRRVEVNILD